MQLAVAAAALVNDGTLVRPHIVSLMPGHLPAAEPARRVLSAETSARMREMLRRAVTSPSGTGRRADVPGLEVGGKTGTAELAGRGGYKAKSVVASFLGAFPMSAPRYVVLVSLIEPKPDPADAQSRITAGVNAAPIAARVIARTAALLGVPKR
jgi:cell division protein FtsI (penicillin-binding protein 3)